MNFFLKLMRFEIGFDLPYSYISVIAWLWRLRFVALFNLFSALSSDHILVVWSSLPPRRVRSGLDHLRWLVARELYPTDSERAREGIVPACWSQRCPSCSGRSRVISFRCRGHGLLRCIVLDDTRDHIRWNLLALQVEINRTLSKGQSLIIVWMMVLISCNSPRGSLMSLHGYSEFGRASSLVLLS